VIVTHDISSTRRIADRVAMLQSGRITWEGPIGTLGRSSNSYVEEFVRRGTLTGPLPEQSRLERVSREC